MGTGEDPQTQKIHSHMTGILSKTNITEQDIIQALNTISAADLAIIPEDELIIVEDGITIPEVGTTVSLSDQIMTLT